MKFFASTFLLLAASVVSAEMNVSSLTWMTGSWTGSIGPSTIEEIWTKPKNNSIQASVRISAEGNVNVHEVVVIRNTEDGARLLLQQWSPELKPLAPPTIMELHEQTENSISFVSSGEAMVEKLMYRRASDDVFEILITMRGQPEFTISMRPGE